MVKIEDINVGIEMAKKEEHHTMFFQNEVTKQYVLSKYTPKCDAIRNIGEDKGNKQTTWIVIGFALGYLVKELLEDISDELNIIVIEPNEELLNLQMEYEDNAQLRQKKNVHFLCGKIDYVFREKLKECIPDSEIDNIKIVCMNVYVRFYYEYCNQIKEAVEDAIYMRIIDMNTVQKYNKLYTENVIKNRYDIADSYQFERLKDVYKDIPAVVVSAGPSLQKNIEYIKNFNGLILVGNRTLAPVLENGNKPDYMFVADPEDIVFDTTRGTMQEDIPLIANDNANNKLIDQHKGKKYFIQTNSNAEELLGVSHIGKLQMGGSVATLCASAAQYMGCNPIILIGQDCAYTDMQIYSNDCANTLFTDKMRNDSDFMDISKIWIDEYYGGKVLSSMDLVSFARWFEKFIESHPEITVINATEGGALIRGAINKPFKEVVEEYQKAKPTISDDINQKVEVKKPVDEHLAEICDGLKNIIKQANTAKGLSNQLKAEYVMYKGMRKEKIASIVKKLDKIDAEIKKKKEETKVLLLIFANLYNQTQTSLENKAKIGETEVEEGIRVAIESFNLYNNIIKASKDFIDIVVQN